MFELLMIGGTVMGNEETAMILETDEMAQAYMSLTTPATKEVIFNTWPRVSDRTFFSDPQTATGAAARWEFDNERNAFYHPDNTATTEMIVSPYKIADFTFDAILTSLESDDDAMGLIIGLQETPTNVRFMSVWVHTGGNSSPRWTLRYGDQHNEASPGHFANLGEVVASNSSVPPARPSSTGGWSGGSSGEQYHIRIRVEKNGNILTAWCSNWNDTGNLIGSSELSVNLESLPREGNMLIDPARLGFAVNSQGKSYFLDYEIRSPTLLEDNVVYSRETGRKWIYNEADYEWELSEETIFDDFDSTVIVKNIRTLDEYIVRGDHVDRVKSYGISEDEIVLELSANTTHSVPIADILTEFTFENPLSLEAVTSNIDVYPVIDGDAIQISTTAETGSFFVYISDNGEHETLAYRRVVVNVS